MSDAKLQAPALREDDVGRLVRRLIGHGGVQPDLTAAVPLAEALQEAGLHDWRVCLEQTLGEMYVEWFPQVGADGSEYRPEGPPVHVLPQLAAAKLATRLGVLVYDFASLVGVMALALGPTDAKPSEATLTTLEVTAPPGTEVGMRWQMPDGRTGLVVWVRDGKAQVLPLAEDGDGPRIGRSMGLAARRRFP